MEYIDTFIKYCSNINEQTLIIIVGGLLLIALFMVARTMLYIAIIITILAIICFVIFGEGKIHINEDIFKNIKDTLQKKLTDKVGEEGSSLKKEASE